MRTLYNEEIEAFGQCMFIIRAQSDGVLVVYYGVKQVDKFLGMSNLIKFSKINVVICGIAVAITGCTTVPQGTLQDTPLGEIADAGTQSGTQVGEEANKAVALNPDQVHIKTDEEIANTVELPEIDLDAPTLESLLLMNLASYQGDWGLAATKAKQVAFETRDYRLARLATLLALRDDDYAKGVSSAQLWHELDENDPDPLNMLLITQLGSGDVEGAKQSVDKHAVGKELDSHIKQIAALLTRQKNGPSAIGVASHIFTSHPESAQAALSSAYVAEFFEDYDLSEEWVSSALSLRPGWELAAQMRAKILASQGKDKERADFIESYAKANPQSIVMQLNYAAEMVRAGNSDLAYEHVISVLKTAPKDIDALQYAGALAEDREENESSARFYQRALNIDPTNDRVRWSLARRYLIDKKYELAERHFGDIRSQDLLFNAQMQIANARYELYGLSSAINTLAGLEPRTEAEYVSLALTRHYLLMAEYKYEDALGAISEVLYYLPENHDLIYARALAAAELSKLDIAESDLRTIFEAKPDHANALNALGYTLADQTDRLAEARELIEKAYSLRPNDAHILDSMGWIAYREKDFENAILFLEKAFSASEEVEIAVHLGEVLWESGQQQKAKEIWFEWAEKEGDNRLLIKTMQRYGFGLDKDEDQNEDENRNGEPENQDLLTTEVSH